MTFIHIYRDSTDPCEEEEEGDGEAGGLEGGGWRVVMIPFCPLAAFLCVPGSVTDTLSHRKRCGGREETSQGEQG